MVARGWLRWAPTVGLSTWGRRGLGCRRFILTAGTGGARHHAVADGEIFELDM